MQLQPLVSDQAVIVYLDFKSPYAYLAVEPTRRIEQELGIRFDWRPFVLDIPSYLGSASLDETGQVTAQNRSAEQWAAIKYAYYDCRRYASASNLTIRGTTKIWNTNLAATAMLWVREVAIEQLPLFIDLIYLPFWRRELNIESSSAIAAILQECGLESASFERWAQSEGTELNAEFQNKAFDAGIYGVPTYAVDGKLFFGREHLPLIAWHLGNKNESSPDVANLLPAKLNLKPTSVTNISIGIDQSLDSLLAIPSIIAFLDTNGLSANWSFIDSQELNELIPRSNQPNRGEVHRQYRELTASDNARRYAKEVNSNENIGNLIAQAIRKYQIKLSVDNTNTREPSPFPGIVIKLNDEIFIGRQHLPLIQAIIDSDRQVAAL